MEKEYLFKHIEIIQSAINRLANNTFLIKGWSITIAIAGLGFFINTNNKFYLLIILFINLIFWILDAYYLRQERLFRELYEDIITKHNSARINKSDFFNMKTSKYNNKVSCILCTMFSFPTFVSYLAIMCISILFNFLI